MQRVSSCVLLLVLMMFGTSRALAQPCNGQTPYQCACVQTTDVQFTICIGPDKYIATVTMCIQQPIAPNTVIESPISRLCAGATPCINPLDEIYWIKKVCLPAGFPATTTIEAVYSALYRSMDLCCNNWRAATIPDCDAGVISPCFPQVQLSIRCTGTAFPRCVNRIGGVGGTVCFETCDACSNYCFMERRYCKAPDPVNPTQRVCKSCELRRCTIGGETCSAPCATGIVNCAAIVDYSAIIGCCTP